MRPQRSSSRRRSGRSAARLLAVALVVQAAALLSLGVPIAQAAVAKVQSGTALTQTTGTSITPTLASASTAANLLLAVIDTAANTTITAPAGWVKATSVFLTGTGTTQIWYDANNAGAISSVHFTLSASDRASAQLSEWSGVEKNTPLDVTSTATKSTSATTLAVSATATAANELAVTSFATSTGTSGNTFTPASGWTNLESAASVSNTADFKTGAGSGSVSETETAATSAQWVGAIATFYGSCGGGSLGLTAPASGSFPTTTLNGASRTLTTTLSFTPNDATASEAGWNLTGTSTTFTTGSHTLPTTATTVTAGSAALAAGTCQLPTNGIGYPVTLPAATVAPTAVKLYDATATTGLGTSTLTLTLGLAVPTAVHAGAYTSTWTFSLASGP